MPDYQQGKIYTIRCRTDDSKIYVGSTIQPLAKRWGGHKVSSKEEKKKNRLIYKTINNDWDNWYYELYELYPCSCKEELCKREGEIIRLIGNLNIVINGRTQKEYDKNHADKIKEYQKEYRENHADKIKKHQKEWYKNNADELIEYQKEYNKNHADKIKDKITCECGCLICKVVIERHRKTQKHINLMLNAINTS